ncbi:MAG TPA: recombinase family protein [Herpetosiphonaceae bacterium]
MSTSNKAVIYTRISSIDQQRGSSLQTQREGCEEYAVRCGLEVVASFFDAQSGFDAEREGLYAALELLRQGDACNLIVYQLDRLNRDFVHSVLTRETVRGLGATLHIAARGSATSDDTIQQDNLEAVLAHREAQLVKERTTRGLRAKAEAGKIIGGGRPPFGYRRMGGGRDARWEIDDTTAATVRLIFQMYVYERLSAKEIALRLTAEGHLRAVDLDGSYANRGKQGRWQITSIHPILANPAYKGETIQNVGGKTYHQ